MGAPPAALAFDIYGTLADVGGIRAHIAAEIGDEASAARIAARWREKQLEYAFRRGLMRAYADFSVCVRDGLTAAFAEAGVDLPPPARARLLAAFARPPLFADVRPALRALATARIRMLAFSNGNRDAAREILRCGGIDEFFADVVSVAEIRDLKPSPAVYAHFLRRAEARAESTWLVSSNPFDVMGARNAGWRAVWARRDDAMFDPWGEFEPDAIVADLRELPRLFQRATPP